MSYTHQEVQGWLARARKLVQDLELEELKLRPDYGRFGRGALTRAIKQELNAGPLKAAELARRLGSSYPSTLQTLRSLASQEIVHRNMTTGMYESLLIDRPEGQLEQEVKAKCLAEPHMRATVMARVLKAKFKDVSIIINELWAQGEIPDYDPDCLRKP